ncbi:MAG TPA: 4-(cytidine 5'-diphospho)-2-C-methyl-D-erythritol kinase [Peptococcaceae bacterium]|nr:MAG: 4-diphosphocytidyl-2-C-methyl-D-erythritol kinase [Clostridia bacterium 41_269]HBT20694.1 4-(cytidine 5'-diphospho)-2-C-methyl-D-erythritol kinase [Peptococcaceae bacterium]
MKREILVQAYAKINLTLEILSKREDGYHNIVSVMQSISLCDRIRVKTEPDGIFVECSCPGVPGGRDNLAYKAADRLKKVLGIKKGAWISIEKGIPSAAGLGGGSSDAAAVLRALNLLWKGGLSEEEFADLAKDVGADVPFFIRGGTALAQGIGEKLKKLSPIPTLWFVLVKPSFGVSTKEIYEKFDSMEKDIKIRPSHGQLLTALYRNDLISAAPHMVNMLEGVTASLYPQVKDIMEVLSGEGCRKVLMCGSGPTVCGVVSSREEVFRIRQRLLKFNYPWKIYIARTVNYGSIIINRSKGGKIWEREDCRP